MDVYSFGNVKKNPLRIAVFISTASCFCISSDYSWPFCGRLVFLLKFTSRVILADIHNDSVILAKNPRIILGSKLLAGGVCCFCQAGGSLDSETRITEQVPTFRNVTHAGDACRQRGCHMEAWP